MREMPMPLMSQVGWKPCSAQTLSSMSIAAPMALRCRRSSWRQYFQRSRTQRRR